MTGLFANCFSLVELPDISNWNLENQINYDHSYIEEFLDNNIPYDKKFDFKPYFNYIRYMFCGCVNLRKLPDISKWNIDKINDISFMFYECQALKELPDISTWNTTNIIDMNNLFSGCKSLTKLPDISNWNTSNVSDMSYMFSGCESLNKLPDISNWKTDNTNNVSYMFNCCSQLIALPEINKWKFNNKVDIEGIFSACSSLLLMPDLTNWNIRNDDNIGIVPSSSGPVTSTFNPTSNDISEPTISSESINNGKISKEYKELPNSTEEEEKEKLRDYYENFYN